MLSHEVMDAQNAIIPSGLKGHHTEFVQTYGAIQNALVLKLAMDVAHVFDFSAGRPIERQDTASIPVLASLLGLEPVRELLLEKATRWLGGAEWVGVDSSKISPELDAVVLELEQDHRRGDRETCRKSIDAFLSHAERLSDPNPQRRWRWAA